MIGALRGVRLVFACAAALASPALVGVAHAQRPAMISGRVMDASTQTPLPSAQIVITAAARFTTTEQDGSFRLEGLPGGAHVLEIRRIGFAPRRDTVNVIPGSRAQIEVALVPIPTELPSVTVEARRAHLGGFWQRKQENIGHFITREDIDRHNPAWVAEIFRGVPGAIVVRTATGRVVASARGRSVTECVAAVFVDGIPYSMSSSGLDDIHPDRVEAIEYYSSPARVPAQFNVTGGTSRPGSVRSGAAIEGSPRCGVVVIWLRGTS